MRSTVKFGYCMLVLLVIFPSAFSININCDEIEVRKVDLEEKEQFLSFVRAAAINYASSFSTQLNIEDIRSLKTIYYDALYNDYPVDCGDQETIENIIDRAMDDILIDETLIYHVGGTFVPTMTTTTSTTTTTIEGLYGSLELVTTQDDYIVSYYSSRANYRLNELESHWIDEYEAQEIQDGEYTYDIEALYVYENEQAQFMVSDGTDTYLTNPLEIGGSYQFPELDGQPTIYLDDTDYYDDPYDIQVLKLTSDSRLTNFGTEDIEIDHIYLEIQRDEGDEYHEDWKALEPPQPLIMNDVGTLYPGNQYTLDDNANPYLAGRMPTSRLIPDYPYRVYAKCIDGEGQIVNAGGLLEDHYEFDVTISYTSLEQDDPTTTTTTTTSTTTTTLPEGTLTAGTRGYWRGDLFEGKARDFDSGYDNHLELENVGSTQEKVCDSSSENLEFNGVNSYAYIADIDQEGLDILDNEDFLIEAWINTVQDTEAYIISKHETDEDPGWALILDSGVPSFKVFIDEETYVVSDGLESLNPINDGKDYYIAVTGEREEELKLYVDGHLIGSTGFDYTGTLDNEYELTLGADNDGDEKFYQGILSRIRITNYMEEGIPEDIEWDLLTAYYDRCLNNEYGGDYSSTQGEWLFENTLSDLTENDNDLTYEGTPTPTYTDEFICDDYLLQKQVLLDGTEYLLIGDDVQTGLDIGTDDYVIETWIKTSQTPSLGDFGTGIISKALYDKGALYGWFLRFKPEPLACSAKPRFGIVSGTDYDYQTSCPVELPVLNDGNWHHLYVAINRNDTIGDDLRLYVDGNFYGSANMLGQDFDNNINFVIGADSSGTESSRFEGSIAYLIIRDFSEYNGLPGYTHSGYSIIDYLAERAYRGYCQG